MLTEIQLPRDLNTRSIPPDVSSKLAAMRSRIERFQDCWNQHHAAQFVAADYELVYQSLDWIKQTQPMTGRMFVEWGCGFATVACLADTLGFASHGIESHGDLFAEAKQTVQQWPSQVDLFQGNFLPGDAEELAYDPTLPSLGHEGRNPYEHWDLEPDDFAIVYSYPWPGEDSFHEDVFSHYAAPGALLLMFIGPNEMRLMRKTSE